MAIFDRFSPPDEPKEFKCDVCGDVIYEGDIILVVGDDEMHPDCFIDYAREILNPEESYK
jgi:hypothetical protein